MTGQAGLVIDELPADAWGADGRLVGWLGEGSRIAMLSGQVVPSSVYLVALSYILTFP